MSTASESFPIARLPLIALTEVLSCLDPVQLITLSQCSTKFKFLVKLVRHKVISQYRLWVALSSKPHVLFQHKIREHGALVFNDPLPRPLNKNKLAEILKVQHLANHILDTFTSIELEGQMNFDLDAGRGKAIFDWASSRKDSLRTVFYKGRLSEHKNILKFLATFQNCRWTALDTRARAHFKCDEPIRVRNLRIQLGRWFSIENLWNFQGTALRVKKSSLKNPDLNTFFKDWKSGTKTCSRALKYVSIENRSLNIPIILADIPHRMHTVAPDSEQFPLMDVWYSVRHDNGLQLARIYRRKDVDQNNILIHFS